MSIVESPKEVEHQNSSLSNPGVDKQTDKGWKSSRERKQVDRLTYANECQLKESKDTDMLQHILKEYKMGITHPLLMMQSIIDEQDTLYLHESKKQSDWNKFSNAMDEELQRHLIDKNMEICQINKKANDIPILPSVWTLSRKRKMIDGKIYKYKARVNVDGSRQIKGIYYDESWSPVASCTTIRFMMIWSIIHRWKAIHVDFVQAFPQAPIDKPMGMKIPKGYMVKQKGKSLQLCQTDDVEENIVSNNK